MMEFSRGRILRIEVHVQGIRFFNYNIHNYDIPLAELHKTMNQIKSDQADAMASPLDTTGLPSGDFNYLVDGETKTDIHMPTAINAPHRSQFNNIITLWQMPLHGSLS